MPGDRPEELGFTLIEVLVALVVSALLMNLVMVGALNARDHAKRTTARETALLVAQAVLAQATVAPFDEGIHDGKQGTLSWSVEENAVARDPRGFFALVRLVVSVSGKDGKKLVTLSTRKLKALELP